jgi:hypothetical protein
MYNHKIIETSKPFIFSKKLNDKSKIIPLNKVNNTLGPMRYFPPANQEWNNSIYVFNNVTNKNISIAQKNLTRLIKSYFNLYFSNKLSYKKKIPTRFRRLAVNKILISEAELKHTSNKVIITLYVYNEERRILINRLKRVEAILLPSCSISPDGENKDTSLVLSLRKRLNLIKKNDVFSFLARLEEVKRYLIEGIKLEKKGLETINKLNSRKEKLLEIQILEENLNKTLTIISSCLNDPVSLKYYENTYNKFIAKTLLEKEIATIAYYKLLLNLNQNKFEDLFISRLSPLISKIYNKEVEFNIINLKAVYLNSDIFTQAIALKLRNRDNRLLKVLRSFLYIVKLPKVNLLKERFAYLKIKNLWINRVKNLSLNSIATNRDRLNDLLTSLFIPDNFTKKSKVSELNYNKVDQITLKTNLLNNVFLLLKHKSMAGVRLEARGRLTRRFTASRSVFKIKWKGSLKNINSSYRGLSSVILRGHLKSNIQYSVINSKTRNGAFGLKGWISGK